MPKRTIGMQSIRVRPGHNRKKEFADLSDIEGYDLLHLFHGWADSVPPDELKDQQRGRYKKITDVVTSGRSVMVEVEAGYFGTAGKTYDTETHTVSHKRSARESATVMTRLLLTVAPGGEVGVFSSEREGNSGAGPDLVKLFKHALVASFPTYSFDTETVIESPAWTQGADLIAVTAVAYAVPVNLADGVTAQPTVLGQLEQRFEPIKGQKILPRFLLSGLRDKTIAASDFMGFADGRDIDETFVTVGRDGREKTYAIDKQRVPSIRVVITEDGDQPLTTTPFIRSCQSEVRDYYQEMGFSWDESWRSGTWTPDQLKVTMPAKA